MDKYSSVLKDYPCPLVFVLGTVEGEPDIHDRLNSTFKSSFNESDTQDLPSILIKVVGNDHVFLQKKRLLKDQTICSNLVSLTTKSDFVSPGISSSNSATPTITSMSPLSSLSPLTSTPVYFQPSFDGILKCNWLDKHHQKLPSVVILTTAFCVDWTSNEWNRRENLLLERYNTIKALVCSRDHVKIMVIGIRTGTGAIEKDIMDERILSFKRHLQLDSKTFTLLNFHDIVDSSPVIRRLCKSIREYSTAYYNSQCKLLKAKEKLIHTVKNQLHESILSARYSFKLGFFYEFLGQKTQSIRYYKQCSQVLADLLKIIDEDWIEQAKNVAEYATFKINNISFQSGNYKNAITQFYFHITSFLKVFTFVPWSHFTWLSEQYVTFAELLEKYKLSDNMELDQAYYYQNAARYSIKRQAAFARAHKISVSKVFDDDDNDSDGSKLSPSSNTQDFDEDERIRENLAAKFKTLITLPPVYIGSVPRFVDPVIAYPTSTEEYELLLKYNFEELEMRVNHSSIIISLLTRAQKCINPLHKRKLAHLYTFFAEQYVYESDFKLALNYYTKASQYIVAEGWINCVIPLLRKIMSCTFYLGKLKQYVAALLQLFAVASENFLTIYEKEELNFKLLSAIKSFKKNDSKESALTNAECLVDNIEYGSAESSKDLIEYELPMDYTIDMTKAKLFDTQVNFDNLSVQVGEEIKVTVSIKSCFLESVSFLSMEIHFTNDCIIKIFRNSNEENSSYNYENEDKFCLTFHPDQTNSYTFKILISESCLQAEKDAYVCIENIYFVYNIPLGNSDVKNQVRFLTSALSSTFMKLKDVFGKYDKSLEDMAVFSNERNSILRINRPLSTVSLLNENIPIQLLQGPVQKINLLFSCGKNDVLNGRVYVSSDFVPNSANNSALFWYPNINDIDINNLENFNYDQLDQIPFHPMILNTSLQPNQPILLNNLAQDEIFCLPLFLRSVTHGSFKIRLFLEYNSNAILCMPTSKDFEIKVIFDRPIQMSYTMKSFKDAPCGVINDGSMSSILRGDTINMTATITCMNALESEIELIGMNLRLDDNNLSLFKLHNSKSSINMLTTSVMKLKKGEICSRSTNVACVSSPKVEFGCDDNFRINSSSPIIASFGSLFLDWRLVDNLLFTKPTGVTINNNNWLLKLGPRENGTDNSLNAIDLTVVTTRVCDMNYIVPSVQLLDPPFDAEVKVPTVAKIGNEFILEMIVTNNLWAYERLVISTKLCDKFILTGFINTVVEILPRSQQTLVFTVIPVKSGNFPLPNIRVAWEKNGYTIIDMGNYDSSWTIYVKP